MTDVRIAEEADLDQVRVLLQLGNDNHFTLNTNKSVPMIKALLKWGRDDPYSPAFRGLFGVIGPVGGTLEAVVMLVKSSVWYSDDVFLSHLHLYVHPDSRSKHYDEILRDWMTSLADQTGMKLAAAVFTPIKAAEKVRLFSRTKGWVLMGAHYLYDPHNPVKVTPEPPATEDAAS